MNSIREYMEKEVKKGFPLGQASPYYDTMPSSSSCSVVIDNMGTTDAADDLNGTLYADPYPATTVTVGIKQYKVVGFYVEWSEKNVFGSGTGPLCRERAVTYVAEHH
jgi:hypothetical protein